MWIIGFSLATIFASVLVLCALPAWGVQSVAANAEQAQTILPEKGKQPASEMQAQKKTEIAPEQNPYVTVIRTYALKYVKPDDIINVAKFYIEGASTSGNILSIRILNINVPIFEDLLKKLDVEKKSILFRIYPILAYREPSSNEKSQALRKSFDQIDDADLKKVLDELRSLWNFKYFLVDTPSFLTVKDGSEANSFRLVSRNSVFELGLFRPQIRGDEPGKRIIAVGQIQLVQTANFSTGKLIETSDVTLKEKGYLVVGVGGSIVGDAIILVVSAEIK
jgi:hypothetical protein